MKARSDCSRSFRSVPPVWVAALCSGLIGSQSSCVDSQITGSIGDRPLRATGTVAAWVDATSYELTEEGGIELEERQSDATLLQLLFFEAAFDPRVDHRTLEPGERAAAEQAQQEGDALVVSIRRGEAIRAGDTITTVETGALPPEVLPYVDGVELRLREPMRASGYPEALSQPASLRTVTLRVDETTPNLVGQLVIDIEKGPSDPDGVAEGRLTIHCSTELLPERIAECNFGGDQGVVDPCTLEVR